MLFMFSLLILIALPPFVFGRCGTLQKAASPVFSLALTCQRSTQTIIALENTQTLDECFRAAGKARGLALNYASLQRRQQYKRRVDNSSVAHFIAVSGRNRLQYWQQPEEFFNCHVLQCPENSTFGSMTYDTRFDYYSLYSSTLDKLNYTCLPELGVFQLHAVPQNFLNATALCRQHGALAHVASAARNNALSSILSNYNALRNKQLTGIQMAYVGLHLNRTRDHHGHFVNDEKERLDCFQYRAWAPGHPRRGGALYNSSCVALTARRTWLAVDCGRQLPFICEIYTKPAAVYHGLFNFEDDCFTDPN